MGRENKPVDVLTVKDEPGIDSYGGNAFLAELISLDFYD